MLLRTGGRDCVRYLLLDVHCRVAQLINDGLDNILIQLVLLGHQLLTTMDESVGPGALSVSAGLDLRGSPDVGLTGDCPDDLRLLNGLLVFVFLIFCCGFIIGLLAPAI